MSWETPGDPNPDDDQGTDVDLHFQRPLANRPGPEEDRGWFHQTNDCHFANDNPDWGIPGDRDDNPSLIRDADHGPGLETIVLPAPQQDADPEQPFIVGVHYFRHSIGFHGDEALPSTVTLRIFLGGVLALETQRVLPQEHQIWEAATIVWTEDVRRAEVLDGDPFVIDPF
jgi:hypothetical protein